MSGATRRVERDEFQQLERQWRRAPGFVTYTAGGSDGGGMVLYRIGGEVVGTHRIPGYGGGYRRDEYRVTEGDA